MGLPLRSSDLDTQVGTAAMSNDGMYKLVRIRRCNRQQLKFKCTEQIQMQLEGTPEVSVQGSLSQWRVGNNKLFFGVLSGFPYLSLYIDTFVCTIDSVQFSLINLYYIQGEIHL